MNDVTVWKSYSHLSDLVGNKLKQTKKQTVFH